MTYQDQKELYADLCQDLKEGRITEAEFRFSALRMGASLKTIAEDMLLYKHKNT